MSNPKNKAAEIKIQRILHKIDALKLSNSYISQLEIPGRKNKWNSLLVEYRKRLWIAVFTIVLLTGCLVVLFLCKKLIGTEPCLLELSAKSQGLFRPPEDCSFCYEAGVVRLANISAIEFEELYAYGPTPVIVTDATEGWPAMEEFNFEFFKKFYQNRRLGAKFSDCYFNTYKWGANSFQEVFELDETLDNLTSESWYMGWSSCYTDESRRLREYYTRPYFLPKNAESDSRDWLFMGSPGEGANMHVDSVKHMSWQAQIRGRKEWILAPPPECFYQCQSVSFIVETGEIVVVDTNRWYHKTNILPGNISITIGAEYD